MTVTKTRAYYAVKSSAWYRPKAPSSSVDTKQSGQAYKAVMPACFVLCPLLALSLPSEFFTNEYALSNLRLLYVYGLFSSEM
jgi:hypothetical protein